MDKAVDQGGGNVQADCQVRLPDAKRPEEDHILTPLHETELVKTLDLLPPR